MVKIFVLGTNPKHLPPNTGAMMKMFEIGNNAQERNAEVGGGGLTLMVPFGWFALKTLKTLSE